MTIYTDPDDVFEWTVVEPESPAEILRQQHPKLAATLSAIAEVNHGQSVRLNIPHPAETIRDVASAVGLNCTVTRQDPFVFVTVWREGPGIVPVDPTVDLNAGVRPSPPTGEPEVTTRPFVRSHGHEPDLDQEGMWWLAPANTRTAFDHEFTECADSFDGTLRDAIDEAARFWPDAAFVAVLP